jgi:hypothetical protein
MRLCCLLLVVGVLLASPAGATVSAAEQDEAVAAIKRLEGKA